jgi:hypothetical protein
MDGQYQMYVIGKRGMLVNGLASINEMLHSAVAIYLILNLAYPACFGQFLGALQEIILPGHEFIGASKRCKDFVGKWT